MKYEIEIDKKLFEVYPEIQLGLLHFQTEVKPADEKFWNYMKEEVLPQVRSRLREKNGVKFQE